MKRLLLSTIIIMSIAVAPKSYGFFSNPADTAALLQILANNIKQLIELKNIIQNAKNHLQMVKDINSGIDQALGLIETHYPNKALDLYRDWQNVSASEDKLEAIYGVIVKSKDELAQKHLDRSVIDAFIQNNETLDHTDDIDRIGEQIKDRSLGASPKGAARLTAQALGVGLHVQNQSLRLQASQLKLQAQKIAYENKIEKEETKMFLESSQQLKNAMESQKNNYQTPRF